MERKSRESVTIRLKSYGGSVSEALAILGRIRSAKVSQVVVEGYGVIMSAAVIILAGAKRRRISQYAEIMNHESHYVAEGRHSEIQHQVEIQEINEKRWAKWMSEFTKKDAKFWYNKGRMKDFHFYAEDAIKYGVADEIF